MKGVTTGLLFQKSNRNTLKIMVDDHVRMIDAEILAAHSSGFPEIEYELPINLIINNMDQEDSQIIMYSELIKTYKDKGFEHVYIDLQHNKTYLHIQWINGMSNEEREERKDVIKQSIWADKRAKKR